MRFYKGRDGNGEFIACLFPGGNLDTNPTYGASINYPRWMQLYEDSVTLHRSPPDFSTLREVKFCEIEVTK